MNQYFNLRIDLKETDSTQDIAKKLLIEDINLNFLITAEKQKNGYGREKRKWESRYGGIYITAGVKKEINLDNINRLSTETAKLIVNFLKEFDIKSKIKHPNDVMALEKGKYKKIAGILIETIPFKNKRYILFGIGINVNNPPPKNIPATSMKKIIGRTLDQKKALNIFLENLEVFLKCL
jgi:BirA family biotin operon repressor/biotin-[acetyl-CoA-carboxylase] ligase